jgi:hypothetical protein
MRVVLTVLLWLLAALLLLVTPGCSALKPYVASDDVTVSFRVIKSGARGETLVLPVTP